MVAYFQPQQPQLEFHFEVHFIVRSTVAVAIRVGFLRQFAWLNLRWLQVTL